ncbi:MAG: hypothetical protein WBB69_01425 [Anaerolineales bacterium]
MIGREFNFHDGEKGSAIAIRITKGKGRQRIVKVLRDGTVVIDLPEEVEDIDQELIKFLSNQLGIEPKRFDIIAGEEGQEKLISILDMNPEVLQKLILKKLA